VSTYIPDEPPLPEPPQLVPGGFGGVGVIELSCGFGAEEPAGVELGAPELGVAGRGGIGGGVVGRGAVAAGAGAGFGGVGAGAGRGDAICVGAGRGVLGAADGVAVVVDVTGAFGAAFRAVFLAAFLRAGFALRTDTLRAAFLAPAFLAPALRPALAVPRLPAFFALRPLRAAAARRLAAVDFAGRPTFLRQRFDFDFDPVRAIKPPVV
jgi:hypothetical protein